MQKPINKNKLQCHEQCNNTTNGNSNVEFSYQEYKNPIIIKTLYNSNGIVRETPYVFWYTRLVLICSDIYYIYRFFYKCVRRDFMCKLNSCVHVWFVHVAPINGEQNKSKKNQAKNKRHHTDTHTHTPKAI